MLELHLCCGRQVVTHLSSVQISFGMQSRTRTKHKLCVWVHNIQMVVQTFSSHKHRGASPLSSRSAAIGTTACVLPTETLATLDTCLTYDDLPDTLSLNKSLAKEASCSVLPARA